MTDNRILMLGGDNRLKFLYEKLKSKGHNCIYENSKSEYALGEIKECKYVILPVPACSDGKSIYSDNKDFMLDCSELADSLTDKHIVFGGVFGKELTYQMDKKNIVYVDINKNEDFLTYNAFLTAQGALLLLLQNIDKLVFGKRILITGFGRVAKALAVTLKGIIPDITVCARNDRQLSLAQCMGFKTIKPENLIDAVGVSDFIFNTVPERIFLKEHIEAINEDSAYFELASRPFGADKDLFTRLNKRYVAGNALPGRFVSRSAGEKIAEIIEKLI